MEHKKTNLKYRIMRTISFFVLWFFIVSIISYFILPEGILRSTNEAKDIAEHSTFWVLAMAIFIRNIIPAIGLCIGCLVAIQIKNVNYPFAYLGLFTMFSINGVTLGTWSFSQATSAAPPLWDRIVGSFDLIHRAGLWEMIGLCLLVAALSNAAIIRIIDGKAVVTPKNFKLTKADFICLICGILLMIIAAIVESNASISGA